MTDADDVLAAARARAAALAHRDEAALLDVLHEDYLWSSHRGTVQDRASYVEGNLRGRITWLRQDLDDAHVAVVGDTAVLRCVARDLVDLGEGPVTFTMPVTQTWVREAGRWRCLAGHAGPRLDG
ncbi:MAG: nuclear transport factor 2 family protein [Kineosporiaceae bacterium]